MARVGLSAGPRPYLLPAKAGGLSALALFLVKKIPAFAGMTFRLLGFKLTP